MLSTLPGQGKGEWGGMGMVFTVGRDADEDAGCSGKEEPWSRTLHFRGSHFSSHYCHERARNPCATRLCLYKPPWLPFIAILQVLGNLQFSAQMAPSLLIVSA